MEAWAAAELSKVELGDERRKKRLIKIVEDLAAQPESSVPQACGNKAATTAAYDFWNSPYIKPGDIIKAHKISTIERIKEQEIVLAIQDTTSIDLTHHPATKGLGYLEQKKLMGFKVHSIFAATTEGVPLGVIDQLMWVRNIEDIGTAKTRRLRKIKDKESQRWLDGLEIAQTEIPAKVRVVTIGDSEIASLRAIPICDVDIARVLLGKEKAIEIRDNPNWFS